MRRVEWKKIGVKLVMTRDTGVCRIMRRIIAVFAFGDIRVGCDGDIYAKLSVIVGARLSRPLSNEIKQFDRFSRFMGNLGMAWGYIRISSPTCRILGLWT